MNAAFYTRHPRSAAPEVVIAKRQRARGLHRSVATFFTLAVIANFVAMSWGPSPTWITYAPLPPLLFLLATGLVMLVSPWIARVRRAGQGKGE